MTLAASQDVLIRRDGRAGRITLNRPAALNALTLGMVRAITAALDAWTDDPDVSVIILDGAGPRGLCAGGDIRAFHTESGEPRHEFARTFWSEEYRLNSRIARYPKPFITFMDGIVMGGGIGLSAHARHRLVTEITKIAMPEVGIGLIPDVGGSWLLSRAPGETGTFLALTGERMDAADAIYAGFADLFVPRDRIEELATALTRPGADVMAMIERYAKPPGPARLAAAREAIDALFHFDSVETILAAAQSGGSDIAALARTEIPKKSPTSLKLTLAALRRARCLPSLEACLDMEYRVVCRIIEGKDFYEGIRAAVIDKDQAPRWNPSCLEDVTPAIVERHFLSLGEAELGLEAAKMQT